MSSDAISSLFYLSPKYNLSVISTIGKANSEAFRSALLLKIMTDVFTSGRLMQTVAVPIHQPESS